MHILLIQLFSVISWLLSTYSCDSATVQASDVRKDRALEPRLRPCRYCDTGCRREETLARAEADEARPRPGEVPRRDLEVEERVSWHPWSCSDYRAYVKLI